MAIQKEIWVNYLIENLFKKNEFINFAVNDDAFVLAGAVVHKPQAGTAVGAVKNRDVLPAQIKKRADVDVTYVLDEFTTDPILIPNAETVELSYDKIASVLGEHVNVLAQLTAEEILYNWVVANSGGFAAATVIRTTGSAVAAHLPSATGNRKKFIKEDLKAARFQLNKQNISNDGRYALISSDMMDQLLDDADLKARDNSMELDMRNGRVMRLYGFELIERSTTLIYDNAGTPVVRALSATAAVTDNDTAICWQRGQVARALGTVDFFEDTKNPLYYGDIYSALIRCGAQKQRKDAKGIISIVQAASA